MPRVETCALERTLAGHSRSGSEGLSVKFASILGTGCVMRAHRTIFHVGAAGLEACAPFGT
jgi:hypothetical protein